MTVHLRSMDLAPAPADRPSEGTAEGREEMQRLVRCARLANTRERVETAFLGRAGGRERSLDVGRLLAGLYWDCLAGFLESEGWTLLDQLGFAAKTDDEQPPAFDLLELRSDEWLELPRNVVAFAERGAERLLVDCRSIENPSPPPQWRLRVRAVEEPADFLTRWEIHASAHHRLRGRSFLPSGEIMCGERAHSRDDLYLDSETITALRAHLRSINSQTPERLRRWGLRRRAGVILAGPPGTGKTLLGKVLADNCERTFLWVTPAFLNNSAEVRQVFRLVRFLAPAIVFLEDLDILAEDRSRIGGNLALGELMNQIDGCHGDHDIFILATTNRVEVLEQAIRNRPGRFDRVIPILPPGPAPRRALLAARLEKATIETQDLDWLAEEAKGRTGAELEVLANTAILRALEDHPPGPGPERLDLTREHLVESLALCPIGKRDTALGF